jgi:hypothetical protein
VQRLRDEPAFRQRAMAIGEDPGRLNGPQRAADLLQRLAQEQGTIPRAQDEATLPTA